MTSAFKKVHVGNLVISNNAPFTLLAGPCVLESRDHAFFMVDELKNLTHKLGIPFIYKTSFDKANRTSISGERGVGIDEGLRILSDIRAAFDVPVVTDVHTEEQCAFVAKHVDMLQTPAFLCRQTDFLKAAALTGKPINVKKGQFLAPWDMKNVASKIESFGNTNILLCERGVSFGYNRLISDFRGLEIMAETGYPVVFDATHSVQEPGGAGLSSKGERQFVPLLVRAALATGVSAIFMEVHQDPKSAPSDGPNMIPLNYLPYLLPHMVALDRLTKDHLSSTPTLGSIYA